MSAHTLTALVMVGVVLVATTASCSYDDAPKLSDASMDVRPSSGCSAIAGFAVVKEQLLPKCSGDQCHSTNNVDGHVVLEADNAFANTVGIPSKTIPAMKLVEPGSPSRSFLYRKLNGTQQDACEVRQIPKLRCGEPMPRESWDPLPEVWITNAREWIACGAPP